MTDEKKDTELIAFGKIVSPCIAKKGDQVLMLNTLNHRMKIRVVKFVRGGVITIDSGIKFLRSGHISTSSVADSHYKLMEPTVEAVARFRDQVEKSEAFKRQLAKEKLDQELILEKLKVEMCAALATMTCAADIRLLLGEFALKEAIERQARLRNESSIGV